MPDKKEGCGLCFAGTGEGLAQAKFSRKSNTEVSLASAIVGLQRELISYE